MGESMVTDDETHDELVERLEEAEARLENLETNFKTLSSLVLNLSDRKAEALEDVGGSDGEGGDDAPDDADGGSSDDSHATSRGYY